LIRRYPKLCFFACEFFIFFWGVNSPSAKPPYLEEQFVCLSLAFLLQPLRLGRPYQEHKVPAGIASKVFLCLKFCKLITCLFLWVKRRLYGALNFCSRVSGKKMREVAVNNSRARLSLCIEAI
jgi:hypothetical protein